jgi:hypothetical protein
MTIVYPGNTNTPRQRLERRASVRGGPGHPTRADLVSMIVGSYREMPGLSLHLHQAVRLFGVHTNACRVVLDELVRRGRLRELADGQYAGAN